MGGFIDSIFGGGDDAPAAPDPWDTAEAQYTFNSKAAQDSAYLNAIDQYGPYGSTTFARRADGTPYAQAVTLAPEVQAMLDSQFGAGTALNQAAARQLSFLPQDRFQLQDTPDARGYAQQAVGDNVLDPNRFADPLAGDLYQSSRQQYVSPFQEQSYTDQANKQSYTDQANQQEYQNQQYASPFQSQSLAPTASTGDIARISYEQAISRFAPDLETMKKQQEIKLAQRGIPVGSEIWNDEMDRMDRTSGQLYEQAARQATLDAGAEQSRQFGQNLQAGQFGASENQRGMSDAQFAAQFGMSDAQFKAQFGSGEDARRLANSQFGAQFGASEDARRLANSQFGAQFGQSENARGMSDAQFGAQFGAGEDARLQGADLSNRSFLGTQQNQQYNQLLSALGYGSNAYQTNLSNQLLERNQPLQEYAALTGASPQFQSPSFMNTAALNVQSPDYTGVVNNNYAQQSANYRQQSANSASSSPWGAIGQIGAAAAPAIFSDEDMKEGRTPADGEMILASFRDMPVDDYRYRDEAQAVYGVPEHRTGTMAQDYAEHFGGDGKVIDMGDAMGKLMAAMKALDKRTMHMEAA